MKNHINISIPMFAAIATGRRKRRASLSHERPGFSLSRKWRSSDGLNLENVNPHNNTKEGDKKNMNNNNFNDNNNRHVSSRVESEYFINKDERVERGQDTERTLLLDFPASPRGLEMEGEIESPKHRHKHHHHHHHQKGHTKHRQAPLLFTLEKMQKAKSVQDQILKGEQDSITAAQRLNLENERWERKRRVSLEQRGLLVRIDDDITTNNKNDDHDHHGCATKQSPFARGFDSLVQ